MAALTSSVRLMVRVEDVEEQGESGENPQTGGDVTAAPSHQFAERVEQEAHRHADGDVEGEAHQRNSGEGRDQFGEVLEVDAGDSAPPSIPPPPSTPDHRLVPGRR